MKNCLTTEIKKAFRNRRFWVSVLIGSLVSLLSAWNVIKRYLEELDFREWLIRESPQDYRNPDLPIYTIYNRWIGANYGEVEIDIFFILIPILAVLAYAWSYHEERKSGYIRNVVLRTGRTPYFLAKYTAAFLSGCITVVIPMAANIMALSAFLPSVNPDVYYDIYNGIGPQNMGFQMFYKMPAFFLIVRMLLICAVGGLSAASVVALSFFIRNKFALLLAPFLFLLTIQYLSSLWYYYISDLSISPMEFIKGGTRNSSGWIAGGYVIIIFLLSFGITMWKGARDDVF